MFKYILSLFLISIILSAETADALKAFKNKEYDKAFKLYEKSAKAGGKKVEDMRVGGKPQASAIKGDEVTFVIDQRVRASDKVYKVVPNDPLKARKALV